MNLQRVPYSAAVVTIVISVINYYQCCNNKKTCSPFIHSFIIQQIIIFPFVIADNNRQHVCFCYETQQYIDMFANVKPLVYCLFPKINCSTSLLCLIPQSLFCTDTFLGCCTICEDRLRLHMNSVSPQQNLYIFLTLYSCLRATNT